MFTKIKKILDEDDSLKEIFSGSVVTFFFKISGMLLGYLVIVLIAKHFGAEGVGIYNLTFNVVIFLALISCLGMDTAILRYVGEFNKKNEDEKLKLIYLKTIQLVLPISILLSIVLFIMANEIANIVFKNHLYASGLQITALALPFLAVSNISIQYIRGLKNIKVSEYLRSVNKPFVNIGLIVVVSFYSTSYLVPIYTATFAVIVTGVISAIYVLKKNLSTKITASFKFDLIELLSTSLPMMASKITIFIMGSISLYILEIFGTSVEVGLYSVALKLSVLVSLVLTVVNNISAPKFAELFWSENYQQLQKLLCQSSRIIFYISLIASVVLFVFAESILSIFGQEFLAAKIALYFFFFFQIVSTWAGSVNFFVNMTGNLQVGRNFVVVNFFFNVCGNLYLIPKYGLNGAAFMTMLSVILNNLYFALYAQLKLNFVTYYFPFFRLAKDIDS